MKSEKALNLLPELLLKWLPFDFLDTDGPFDLNAMSEMGDVLADQLYSHFAPFKDLPKFDIIEVLELDPLSTECRQYLNKNVKLEKWVADRKAFLDQVHSLPSWLDFDQVERGQQLFATYFAQITNILLYGGLLPGYSFPRMAKVLMQTGYLAKPREITKRLVETADFVLDTMHSVDSIKPNGFGWKTTVRVRALHASVRKRLGERASCPVTGSVGSCPLGHKEAGFPINQADMLATLMAFSVLPMIHLSQNTAITVQDREDYIAAWRYVGHVIGIAPEFDVLEKGFEHCVHFFARYFVEYLDPSDPNSRKILEATLKTLSPLGGKQLHVESIRKYVEAPLADQMNLAPSHSLFQHVVVIRAFLLSVSPIRFLVNLVQYFLVKILAWYMGADSLYRVKNF
jgi:hypothetical protein